MHILLLGNLPVPSKYKKYIEYLQELQLKEEVYEKEIVDTLIERFIEIANDKMHMKEVHARKHEIVHRKTLLEERISSMIVAMQTSNKYLPQNEFTLHSSLIVPSRGAAIEPSTFSFPGTDKTQTGAATKKVLDLNMSHQSAITQNTKGEKSIFEEEPRPIKEKEEEDKETNTICEQSSISEISNMNSINAVRETDNSSYIQFPYTSNNDQVITVERNNDIFNSPTLLDYSLPSCDSNSPQPSETREEIGINDAQDKPVINTTRSVARIVDQLNSVSMNSPDIKEHPSLTKKTERTHLHPKVQLLHIKEELSQVTAHLLSTLVYIIEIEDELKELENNE
ncbi:hypothetical protein NEOKW01_0190 [Nematocida sp. AWRm80]|nr:hypothetical protein NEOKW01_0190 [Nematocida sp. AWRm80]